MLNNEDFKKIIHLTPLISIDFVLSFDNKYLLGFRRNEPAKNFWFVPGGRILKNETISQAIKRISLSELNFIIEENRLKFNKITEHIYSNNFFNDEFSTHYISLSYIYYLSNEELKFINLNNQHNEIKWFNFNEIMNNENVHKNTKILFN